MPIKLQEIKRRKDFKKFVRYTFDLYKDNQYWIPPIIKGELDVLLPGRNPAFEHCDAIYVLALKNGKVVGRIAGIINHLCNRSSGKLQARFGWFDFEDDEEVSTSLIRFIENWALNEGMNELIGPIGFTTFDRQGLLVEGFDQLPTIASTYNYSYYAKHIEQHGYEKQTDYLEFEIKTPDKIPEKPTQIINIIKNKYRLTPLHAKSRKELISYADQVFHVINESYKEILGFVPLTQKQCKFFIKKYFSVIHPNFTTAVLDQNEKMVGFQIAMPSLSRAFQKANGKLFPFGIVHIIKAIKNPERVDVLLVGVLPEFQRKGVNAFFFSELAKACIQKNIRFAESNGLLEENLKIQNFLRYVEAKLHKRRRLYYKTLQ